jgi:hypothetical protein
MRIIRQEFDNDRETMLLYCLPSRYVPASFHLGDDQWLPREDVVASHWESNLNEDVNKLAYGSGLARLAQIEVMIFSELVTAPRGSGHRLRVRPVAWSIRNDSNRSATNGPQFEARQIPIWRLIRYHPPITSFIRLLILRDSSDAIKWPYWSLTRRFHAVWGIQTKELGQNLQ